MSERQFQHFTTNAASSLSSSQRDALSSDQRYALEQAVTGLRYAKRNSAHLSCGENSHLKIFNQTHLWQKNDKKNIMMKRIG